MTRHYRDNVAGQYTEASPDEASVTCEMYKMLPLRLVSRLWGKMNGVVLPEWAREKVYTGYGKAFGCLMDEVEKPLKEYKNLGEFFTRNLKPGSREVMDFASFIIIIIIIIIIILILIIIIIIIIIIINIIILIIIIIIVVVLVFVFLFGKSLLLLFVVF